MKCQHCGRGAISGLEGRLNHEPTCPIYSVTKSHASVTSPALPNVVQIPGVLEVDTRRGVIYFHSEQGWTVLRIGGLPRPVPNPTEGMRQLDIILGTGCNWHGEPSEYSFDENKRRD